MGARFVQKGTHGWSVLAVRDPGFDWNLDCVPNGEFSKVRGFLDYGGSRNEQDFLARQASDLAGLGCSDLRHLGDGVVSFWIRPYLDEAVSVLGCPQQVSRLMVAGKRGKEDDSVPQNETQINLDESATSGLDRAPASADLSAVELENNDELDELMRQDFVDEQDTNENARPLEELSDESEAAGDLEMRWYILKVQVNRENSICETLERRIKIAGIGRYFSDILVPTEDVREYAKSGKQRIVKRKLFPGYIVVKMHINDESWFLVRDTPGIGDFTGAAGKPVALSDAEINRIISTTRPDPQASTEEVVKTAIRFKSGDHVRVKDGYFQNCEGDVSAIDERNGRVTVLISFLGRPNPVQLDHWQIEQI